MRTRLRFIAAISFFAAATCGQAQDSPPLKSATDETLEWIHQVTLRPQFGGERSGTRKWMRAPTVSIMKASTDQANVVGEAVKQINEVLAKTPLKGVVLGQPDNDKADILVYVAPQDQLPAHAKRHNIDMRDKHNVSCTGQQNNKFELQRGFVFLSSDKLEGDNLRRGALWGIVSALGFQQTSTILPDSLFAGHDLTDVDRKLIVFFYNHVPPMTDVRELSKLYKQHWPK